MWTQRGGEIAKKGKKRGGDGRTEREREKTIYVDTVCVLSDVEAGSIGNVGEPGVAEGGGGGVQCGRGRYSVLSGRWVSRRWGGERDVGKLRALSWMQLGALFPVFLLFLFTIALFRIVEHTSSKFVLVVS